jgi:hypothetical protein
LKHHTSGDQANDIKQERGCIQENYLRTVHKPHLWVLHELILKFSARFPSAGDKDFEKSDAFNRILITGCLKLFS